MVNIPRTQSCPVEREWFVSVYSVFPDARASSGTREACRSFADEYNTPKLYFLGTDWSLAAVVPQRPCKEGHSAALTVSETTLLPISII